MRYSLFYRFRDTTEFFPFVLFCFFLLCIHDHGSFVICRASSVRSKHLCDHLDDALLHAMSGCELSRVRTEFDQLRIVPTVPPHPVQPNCKLSGHGRLGNVFVSTHGQVHIATPPLRVTPCGCLRCFSQQVAQQCIALLADVSQPLFAGTGVFARMSPV
jgi:hypothetical protein